MKSHLARYWEFFSRARKQSSVRIESVWRVHSPSAFGGWQVQRGGRREETELSRATRISVSIFREWQRTSGACARLSSHASPLANWISSRSHNRDSWSSRCGGSWYKVCGGALRRNCCNQSYYLIWDRSNSGKKSNLESLIVKLQNDDASRVGLRKK